jgi:predicted esterase
MRSFITALALAASAAAELIVLPPITKQGQDLAIVWIQGMDCDNTGYEPIAAEVQNQGYLKGQRIWVGIPEFPLNAPNGELIDQKVNETLSELRKQGFTGDKVVLAGHSAGGAVAQGYANDHADVIKAQVLMGAAITRDHREIKSDGTTKFNYDVPTLTLGGTKDGMMRISRIAESFWHSDVNIQKSQKNLFPVMALEGVSHM